MQAYTPKPLPLSFTVLLALVLASMLAQNVAEAFRVAMLPFVIWYFLPAFVFNGIMYGALDTCINAKIKNDSNFKRVQAMLLVSVVITVPFHALNVLFYMILHSFLGRG